MSRSYSYITFFAALIAGMLPATGFCMTTLKQVQVSNGSQIDLLFDGKIGKSQIRTEFFNDIIQISLNDVSVYPAKISSVNGGKLVKIFAYQYAPKLVRCRLTVKGKAEDFKDRFQVSANGKMMTLRLADESAVVAAKVNRVSPASAQKTHASAQEPSKASSSEETALLERVMKGSPDKEKAQGKQAEAPGDRKAEKIRLGGGKPLPSPMGVLGKLAAVIALFGVLAMAAKKFAQGRNGGSRLNARLAKDMGSKSPASNWISALGGLARNASKGLTRKEKMIEVLSNHHLGPKKSIAVVKVMGRTLVLGVTNDSINLISQVEGDLNADGIELDDLLSAGGAALETKSPAQASVPAATAAPRRAQQAMAGYEFSAMLSAESQKPASPNVRSQIRSRLEGLKQL